MSLKDNASLEAMDVVTFIYKDVGGGTSLNVCISSRSLCVYILYKVVVLHLQHSSDLLIQQCKTVVI